MWLGIVEKAQSWGFGAMIGGPALPLAQFLNPGLFRANPPAIVLFLFGMSLGAGLHLLVQQFTRPTTPPYDDFSARLKIIEGPGKALGRERQRRAIAVLVEAYALRDLPPVSELRAAYLHVRTSPVEGRSSEHEMDTMVQERGLFMDKNHDTILPSYMREIIADVSQLTR